MLITCTQMTSPVDDPLNKILSELPAPGEEMLANKQIAITLDLIQQSRDNLGELENDRWFITSWREGGKEGTAYIHVYNAYLRPCITDGVQLSGRFFDLGGKGGGGGRGGGRGGGEGRGKDLNELFIGNNFICYRGGGTLGVFSAI